MIDTIKAKLKAAWLKVKKWTIAGLVAIGILSAPMILAAPKDFTWSNPTQRVDGTAFDPATEQAETRIYCDGATTPTATAVGDATALTVEFSFGEHTCYATVVDTFGQESDPSNSVVFVITPARPNPPVLSVN